jgi:hypothetical protein
MIPTTEQTEKLHNWYCELTKKYVVYTITHHYLWEQWLSLGHTKEDLELVIRYLWTEIKAGRRTEKAFKMGTLLRDTIGYGDDLAQAKSQATIKAKELARTPMVDSGKAEVLKATHRPETPPNDHCAPISEHVAGLLAKWKEEHA